MMLGKLFRLSIFVRFTQKTWQIWLSCVEATFSCNVGGAIEVLILLWGSEPAIVVLDVG